MSAVRGAKDEVLNINVSGKKYAVRRSTLTAIPDSKLSDMFKASTTKTVPQDKSGNYYLDRDPKTFRYILSYLRLKKERNLTSLALPMKPDDLAKLVGEADALNLADLKAQCLEMLQRFQREESNYVLAYVTELLHKYETSHYGAGSAPSVKDDTYGDW